MPGASKTSTVPAALSAADPRVESASPGTWHLGLAGPAPVSIQCRDGWTQVATLTPFDIDASDAAAYWFLVESHGRSTNAKFVIQDLFPHKPQAAVHVAAELPVDAYADDVRVQSWLAQTLFEIQAVHTQEPVEYPAEDDADVDSAPATEDAWRLELVDLVTDLGLHPIHDGSQLSIVAAAKGHDHRVIVDRHRASTRLRLTTGTGDVVAPTAPMRQTLGLFLLRAAAAIRFARPYTEAIESIEDEDSCAYIVGFEVELPHGHSSVEFKHALAAVVSAVERFETEIENLATHAALCAAYAAISDDGGFAVDFSNPNPPTNSGE